MRKLFSAALFISIIVSATIAPAQTVKYRRWGMTGGYKDKVIGPNSWRVVTGTNGGAPEGSAGRIALYRAAELTSLAGFRYFQIINQKGSQMYMGIGWGPATIRGPGGAELTIIAVNDPAAPQTCLAKQPELCTTLDAQETMDKIKPYLVFPESK
ncbi:CC0125/CC1285 family lipoprotein [Sphingobium quisquiliarum]|uniref:CC0125/CC1285 family lipoprotein n=1 Tax=Sphingobium quisquiliarum TaxID=538379 RepID=UPI001269607A|nr:hypothetical protein [Sphingobium quisquiliarum]